MKTGIRTYRMVLWMLWWMLTGAGITACEGVIFDDEGDCSYTYRVKFRYDWNMKFADAFANEVKSVALYAFDPQGNLVWQNTEQGEQLAAADYAMTLDVAPGTYTLVAWGGLLDGRSFTVPADVSTLEALTCTLNRHHDADGNARVEDDLLPLFHGTIDCTLTDEPGIHTLEFPLMRNTNVVRVVLQHVAGEPLEDGRFTFSITDSNGRMGWDNTLLTDEQLTYYAWHTESGTVGMQPDESRTATQASVMVAELTVARLMEGGGTRLTVTDNLLGRTVFSIPVVDYALLVKGNYNRPMSDQEYLDRQDEYSMTFFLDDDGSWLDAYIYVNSWKIVLQNSEL